MTKAELTELITRLEQKSNMVMAELDYDIKELLATQTKVKNLELAIIGLNKEISSMSAELIEAHNQLQAMEGKID